MTAWTQRVLSLLVTAGALVLLLTSPSLALANTDARLLQVGSKGLYSYDVWTGESSLLIE